MFLKITQSFALKSAGAIVGLFITILITRYYDKNEAGEVFLLLSILAIVSAASRLGSDTVVTRRASVAKVSDDLSKVISTFILLIIFAIPINWVIYTTLTYTFFENIALSPQIINYVFWAGFFDALLCVYARVLQGIGWPLLFLFALLLQKIIFVLLLYWTGAEQEISHFFLNYILSCLIPIIMIGLILKIKKGGKFSGLDKTYASNFFKESMPMLFVTVVSVLVQHSTNFFVALFSTKADVASYSVCFRVVSVVGFLVVAANAVLAPILSVAYQDNSVRAAYDIFKKSTKLLFVIALPIFSVFFLFSDYVLSLFGPEYSQLNRILIIMVFGQVFNISTGVIVSLYLMTEFGREYKNIFFYASLVSVVLYAISAYFWGLEGVAYAYTFSMILINSWLLLNYRVNLL